MLHRAKHGLITAKLRWTNSWMQLPLPLFLRLSPTLYSSPRLSSILLYVMVHCMFHGPLPSPLPSPLPLLPYFYILVFSHKQCKCFLPTLSMYISLRQHVWSLVTLQCLLSVCVSDLKSDTDLQPDLARLSIYVLTCQSDPIKHTKTYCGSLGFTSCVAI